MIENDFKKMMSLQQLPDSWWISVDGTVEEKPVTLAVAVARKRGSHDSAVYLANEVLTQNAEWIELELPRVHITPTAQPAPAKTKEVVFKVPVRPAKPVDAPAAAAAPAPADTPAPVAAASAAPAAAASPAPTAAKTHAPAAAGSRAPAGKGGDKKPMIIVIGVVVVLLVIVVAALLMLPGDKDATASSGPAAPVAKPAAPLAPGVLVARGSQWRYASAKASEGAQWFGKDFDPSAWAPVQAPLGCGYGADMPLASYVSGLDGRIVLVAKFDAPAKGRKLILKYRCDDGFGAFVNGAAPVASVNMQGGNEAKTAVTPADAKAWKQVDLAIGVSDLKPKGNTLAVKLVKSGDAADKTLLFDAELCYE